MGITLGSNFTVNTGLPLDDRTVVADLTERDALDLGRRYEGLQVFVRTELKTYQLQGGIGNVNWVESGGTGAGGAAVINVDTFTGDGIITTFTLSDDPVSIENTTVFVDGVYQKKTDSYTLVGLDIVFTEAPPQNTLDPNNIEVIYTTPTTPLVIPDGSITNAKLASGLLDGISSVSNRINNTGATHSIGASFATVPNLSVTVTVKNKPVIIQLDSGVTSSGGGFPSASNFNINSSTAVRLLKNGVPIAHMVLQTGVYPCQVFNVIDTENVAGTYTYTVEARLLGGTASMDGNIVLKAIQF